MIRKLTETVGTRQKGGHFLTFQERLYEMASNTMIIFFSGLLRQNAPVRTNDEKLVWHQ